MLTRLRLDALTTGWNSRPSSRIDEAIDISYEAVEAVGQGQGRQGKLVVIGGDAGFGEAGN